MGCLRNKSGQVAVEYVGVILCVIAAMALAGVYFQRAFQGRMRQTSDQLGEQYEPGATDADMTTMVVRDVETVIWKDQEPETFIDDEAVYGVWEFESTNVDETLRFGTESVGP